MPRSIVFGNGNMLVTLDNKLMIRDLYFPYVGMEDQTTYNHFHRIGIWIDNKFSWLYENDWQNEILYKSETLVGQCSAINNKLGLKIIFEDTVLSNQNIFIRKIKFINLQDNHRKFRVFFHQDFHLYGDKLQDTALYEPDTNTIIHYRGKRYFMVNGLSKYGGMSTYTTGKSEYHGYIGTWKDAEDGSLQRNPITQGSVDSTIGFNLEINPNSEEILYFWMCAGKRFREINKLNQYVVTNKPAKIIEHTEQYWRNWVNKKKITCTGVDTNIIAAFKQSLLIIRTQIDNRGAIIAANDSDIMKFNKDTYTYMWPRDGALVAKTLSMTGYLEITKRFFSFCADVITDEGFMMHKYNPDKSVGSSWHPWYNQNKKQLPIQEDETALVLYSLWEHYKQFKNIEYIHDIYKPLVKKAADFIEKYVHPTTNLPYESYDLWEEKRGVSTFTCATVYAGLIAASKLAQLIGHKSDSKRYDQQAKNIKKATLKFLWDDEEKYFLKRVQCDTKGNIIERDKTVESSTMSIFLFELLPFNDEKVIENMKKIKEKLTVKTNIGGLARYEKDTYQKDFSDNDFNKIPGNPWVITSLWYAQWLSLMAKKGEDLVKPLNIIKWSIKYANKAYIMPEQFDPYTGKHISVAPLTWSHATFVETVFKYCERNNKIKGIGTCQITKVIS